MDGYGRREMDAGAKYKLVPTVPYPKPRREPALLMCVVSSLHLQ